MDLSKYKANPKTAYLAAALEHIQNEADKLEMIKQMDEILAGDAVEEEFPNEVVMEVRAGVGGEEAALFAEELAHMYMAYATGQGWGTRVLSESKSDLGGYKEASVEIKGTPSRRTFASLEWYCKC